MKWKLCLIIFLVIFSGIIFYKTTGNTIKQEFFVAKVVDGDTITLENGLKVRLLGINTPEKNMLYYNEAKEFLKQKIENKTIELEINPNNKYDKYNRILAHVFLNKELVNKEILENGLGNLYYYGKDSHFNELKDAEKRAKANHLGIWKKSDDAECLSLVRLKYLEEERCKNQEQLILFNNCEEISVKIKDSANHIFKEKINRGIYEKNFSCVFNDDGDSLFIWDEKGLVLYSEYSP